MAQKWVVKLGYKLAEEGKTSDEINAAVKAEKARLDYGCTSDIFSPECFNCELPDCPYEA